MSSSALVGHSPRTQTLVTSFRNTVSISAGDDVSIIAADDITISASGKIVISGMSGVTISPGEGVVDVNRMYLVADGGDGSYEMPVANDGITTAHWYLAPPCRISPSLVLTELRCFISISGVGIANPAGSIVGIVGRNCSIGRVPSAFTSVLSAKLECLGIIGTYVDLAVATSDSNDLPQGSTALADATLMFGGGTWISGELRPARPTVLSDIPGKYLYFVTDGVTGGVNSVSIGLFRLTIIGLGPFV